MTAYQMEAENRIKALFDLQIRDFLFVAEQLQGHKLEEFLKLKADQFLEMRHIVTNYCHELRANDISSLPEIENKKGGYQN